MTLRHLVKATLLVAGALLCLPSCSRHDDRLRIFIQTGETSARGTEQNYAAFLTDWKSLLSERGAEVEGAARFPNKTQLAKTDVLVIYSDREAHSAAEMSELNAFLKRGGGLVLIHDAIRGLDPDWLKLTVGGALDKAPARSRSGVMGLYFQGARHPIVEGVSNFDIDDKLPPTSKLNPDATVLATTFQSTNEIVPQIWAYENKEHRAVVCLPGENQSTFLLPHFRALILRSIAWAGKRRVDLLTSNLELAHLKYPGGEPTPPEEAVKKLKVHPEFTATLAAAEPLIVGPIWMDWDAKGRMWVATAPEYSLSTGTNRAAKDAIVILEDSKGGGRMDKKRVFYEGTNLITSFVFHRDGVIVSEPPDLAWIRDTDGDGISDKREVLFTGFGHRDPGSVINSLHWGRDGWVYCDQGESGNDSERIANREGKLMGKIGNGIFRFRPDGTAIEMVSAFTNNSWGFDFSWDGEMFFSKAKGPHVAHVMMPEQFLARGRVAKTTSDKTIEDHQKVFPLIADQPHEFVPLPLMAQFTTASGCMLYEGGTWPMRYHNSQFVCDPSLHIVHQDIITPLVEGAIGYEASRAQSEEFIAATDPWFRPVGTHYGPDGAMYLLDAYGQREVHHENSGNEPVSAEQTEGLHGRIWRIQNKHARKLEVPALVDTASSNLVKALAHPNAWVRLTAQRQLVERGETNVNKALTSLVLSNRVPYVRIDALWTLQQLHGLRETNLIHAVDDAHPGVQKNALRVVTERGVILSTNLEKAVVKQVKDTDDRVKLNALFALQQGGLAKETRQSVLRHFSEQKDLWAKSAYLGIAMTSPMEFIKEALATDKGEHLKDLVSTLCDHLVETRSLSNAVYIVQRLARDGKKAGSSLLQAAIFDSFTRADSEFVPAWTPELEKAFKTLLDAESATVRYNSLALVNRWDKKNALAGQAATAKKELLEDLKYLEKDDARMRVISAVMSIPSIHPDIIPILEKVLDTNFSAAVQNHLVKEFARSPEKAVAPALIRHFSKLNPEGRQLAVNTLLKREEWVSTLIDAIADKGIGLRDLGIVAVNRLRNYPEPALARHAAEVIEPIQGPFEKDKLALIAKLRPVLGERADLKNGGEMFRNNCGICHKFGEKDKDREKAKELGPELNGIGVYGPAMLLTHILDPNRVVETNFIAYNVSTKKQGNYYGIIISETKDSLKIRNFEGETEIRAGDIVLKKSTGVSFMPEGIERLGEKNVRDIIAYLVEKASKTYRPLDLATAFTADSRKTLFAEQGGSPSLEFKKFGLISIDHVPFNIANPDSLAEGRNLIVLRGGKGFTKTLPQRAEIPVETAAKRIHVLGGIAGWGYASGRGGKTNDPLVRAQIVYADKKSEELIFKNGYEFADYVKRIDVPGSRYVPDLLAEGQVRLFSFAPKRTNEISKIILESVDGAAAPTFVAMTAQVLDR